MNHQANSYTRASGQAHRCSASGRRCSDARVAAAAADGLSDADIAFAGSADARTIAYCVYCNISYLLLDVKRRAMINGR